MRIILIAIFFLVSTKSFSQERFFEFLPGWRNLKIVEKGNKYISFGLTFNGGISNHNYQFANISQTGVFLDAWEFDLDSVLLIQSRYTNDVSQSGQDFFVSGSIMGEQSNRFYGTLIQFNSDFSDTLGFKSFNILPGNGTMIRSHISLNPNKFILGGFLQNTDFQVYPSLMQTDSLGSIAWRQDYFCGNDCDLYPVHILQTADGGYFLTCAELHNSGFSGFAEKTAIIKTDSLGNEQYRLHPGQPELFTVRGWVLPTDDGNYITAYSDPRTITDNEPQVNPESTIWIYKFDIDGNSIFEISLIDFLPLFPVFESTYPYTISQMINTSDGNILIVGDASIPGFILKITQEGEALWIRLIEPPQAANNTADVEKTKILGITPTTDGGYIMAGEYFSTSGNIFPEGIQTAIAVKVDEFGCLEPGCQLADAIAEIPKADLGLRVWPNPASETVNISVAENVQIEKVRIYELSGRAVLESSVNENRIKIDVGGLSPGMYLIEVETGDGYREIKRLVVE